MGIRLIGLAILLLASWATESPLRADVMVRPQPLAMQGLTGGSEVVRVGGGPLQQAEEYPDKLDPATVDKYRQMGREAAQRDAAHMKKYKDFLDGEVKAGRLQPAVADQMYRQEWRAIRQERRQGQGLNCTGMQIGPFTDMTCQ